MHPPSPAAFVAFPQANIEDWYSATQSKLLGRGSFGSVSQFYDDRDKLLRMKHRIYGEEPSPNWPETDENVYYLDWNPTVEIVEEITKWQDTAAYLCYFSLVALLRLDEQLFPADLSRYFSQSRFEMVVRLLEKLYQDFDRAQAMQEIGGERPIVAIKIISPEPIFSLGEAEKSAKTEVYALSQVASTVASWKKPPLQAVDPQVVARARLGDAFVTSYSGNVANEPVIIILQGVSHEDKVVVIKERIALLTGIPVEQQRLFKGGSSPLLALTDEDALEEYFEADDRIQVSLVLIFPPVGCQTVLGTPAIACMLDYFYTPVGARHWQPAYYIVMTRVFGPSLLSLVNHLLHPERNDGKGLPGPLIWYTAWVMALALDHMHRNGIIHNDVKLDNIVYDVQNGSVTLVDLGLACQAIPGDKEAGEMDSCDSKSGSPEYFSSEVFAQGKRYPVTDIWALGVTLWEMASGKYYKVSSHMQELSRLIAQGATPDLTQVDTSLYEVGALLVLLNNMLQVDPRKRWTTKQVQQYIRNKFRHLGNSESEIVATLRGMGKAMVDQEINLEAARRIREREPK